MKKWIAIVALLAMMLTLAACSGKDATITGMVMSVDGAVITLMETGELGERPPMGQNGAMPNPPAGMEGATPPEGMEGAMMPGSFDPEKMEGNAEGQNPQRPPMGQMPDGKMGEMITLDFTNAHISIEIQNGKESGTIADLTPGMMVTVTVDGKGNATYVLVRQPAGPGMGPGGTNPNTVK